MIKKKYHPNPATRNMLLVDRIKKSVVVNDLTGCHEWTAAKSRWGYGRIRVNSREFHVHTLTWEMFNGPVPAGRFVCHHCDNPPCCNPDHLFVGTPLDNVLDMIAKGRAPVGIKHGMAKLAEAQVLAIRSDERMGTVIAREYGISTAMVSLIRNRKNWTHL